MGKIIALDVGGTFVKHAAFESGTLLPESAGQFPVHEKGDSREILEPMLDFLKTNRARDIAVSIPGPMDYPTGTSRMKHKFVSIFGISMKDYFENGIPGAKAAFVHDGVAYLAGVMRLGETEGAERPCGVMLGTGLGFAMAEEGRILINEADTPWRPLWNMPFREGITEDYLSGRAIRAAYRKAAGTEADVREIADLARRGDEAALRIFKDAGQVLGELLERRRKEMGIDLVVLGGQISKASDLLLPAAREETDLTIRPTDYPDSAALYGAVAFFEQGADLVRRVS